MSETKTQITDDSRKPARPCEDKLEALYKDVGIMAVVAAAAYVKRPAKQAGTKTA